MVEVKEIPHKLLINAVRGYQRVISPWLGRHCKFTPSCSQFTIDALRRYSLPQALVKALGRFLRCHPWSHGGHDPA